MSDDVPAPEPSFTVVRGNPTDAELAAVLAVLTAQTQRARVSEEPRPASGWSAYWRAMRAPLLPGPGAWRASGRAT
jgi:hypothetical protein